MWFDYGKKETKKISSRRRLFSRMYQTLANGGICQAVFLASSHTTSIAQSVEQPSWHKKSHTVPALFTHKRTMTVMGKRL
jgi:hypothetical protein